MATIQTTIKLHERENFNDEEDQKMDKALELLTIVINSDAFRRSILNFEYDNKKQFSRNYVDLSTPLSNQEVYELFMSGKESTNGVANNVLDLRWKISAKCPDSAIGTTFNRQRTETYRCKLEEMSAESFAGHIAHEYCHYLGFTHTKKYIVSRPYTVPYGIGKIVRDLCGAYVALQQLTSTELDNLTSVGNLVKGLK